MDGMAVTNETMVHRPQPNRPASNPARPPARASRAARRGANFQTGIGANPLPASGSQEAPHPHDSDGTTLPTDLLGDLLGDLVMPGAAGRGGRAAVDVNAINPVFQLAT